MIFNRRLSYYSVPDEVRGNVKLSDNRLAALSQSLACPMNLLRLTDKGLYCPAGGFYIDPWTRVDRALVTHAHSDHAVPGSRNYLACQAGEHILTKRLGPMGRKSFLRYEESKTVNGVRVSFHPAGHVLG
ncbi:MAG: hypothetical protein VYE67_12170, partial [Planctomycetota bacterium]|nr:hypothetical protein [Planctomycetota bacterium]